MTKNEYMNIHQWIRRHYGRADKCVSPDCNGISKAFSYALIKGKEHGKDGGNYMTLCNSCHQKYDFVEEKRKHLRVMTPKRRLAHRLVQLGRKHPIEQNRKHSEAMSGSKNPMFGVSVKGAAHHFFGKHHSPETRNKIRKARAKFSDSEIDEIRTLYNLGAKQSVIATEFNTSRPSINRIVHNQRYTLCQ